MTVSRETPRRPPVRWRSRWLSVSLAVAIAGTLSVACAHPPSPSGWAGAQAVSVDGTHSILVARKGKLYSMEGQDQSDVTTNYNWRFPPSDKSTYPLSEDGRADLAAMVDDLSGVDASAKSQLKDTLDTVHLSGPSAKAFKDAVSASGATESERGKLNDALDTQVKFESDALGRIQAFYGDIALSADGKTAYIASFKGTVFALDVQTSAARWIRDAGDGIVGGIARDGNTLYFGTKGKHLYAVDAETGDRQWQFDARGEIRATPTIDGDTVYLSSLDGSVYALDKTQQGKQKWVFSGAKSGIPARPIVAAGKVYVGAFDNKLYALSADTGSVAWTLSTDNWVWATPTVKDGTVYAASLDGKVYAVDATSGAARWDQPFDAGAPIRSSPLVTDEGLVVAARNGRVSLLDLPTGQAKVGPVALAANTKVLADVTTNDDGSAIYVVPTGTTFFVLNDQLEAKSVLLPQ